MDSLNSQQFCKSNNFLLCCPKKQSKKQYIKYKSHYSKYKINPQLTFHSEIKQQSQKIASNQKDKNTDFANTDFGKASTITNMVKQSSVILGKRVASQNKISLISSLTEDQTTNNNKNRVKTQIIHKIGKNSHNKNQKSSKALTNTNIDTQQRQEIAIKNNFIQPKKYQCINKLNLNNIPKKLQSNQSQPSSYQITPRFNLTNYQQTNHQIQQIIYQQHPLVNHKQINNNTFRKKSKQQSMNGYDRVKSIKQAMIKQKNQYQKLNIKLTNTQNIIISPNFSPKFQKIQYFNQNPEDKYQQTPRFSKHLNSKDCTRDISYGQVSQFKNIFDYQNTLGIKLCDQFVYSTHLFRTKCSKNLQQDARSVHSIISQAKQSPILKVTQSLIVRDFFKQGQQLTLLDNLYFKSLSAMQQSVCNSQKQQ